MWITLWKGTKITWNRPFFKKVIHSWTFNRMLKKAVDIVDKLDAQQIFAYIYDISGAHSY